MKFSDVLAGHVFPDETQIANIWATADFCLDTNVLLDVYRYTEQSRIAFLSLLKSIGGRLFVPHRVAVEFARNRVGVIRGHFAPQRSLRSQLKEAAQKIAKAHPGHPHLPEISQLIEQMIELVNYRFGEAERKHQELVGDDFVLRELLAVIGDDVGDPISESELQKEYKRRKDGITPPFCKMDDDKDEERRTGDVAIWLELMRQYEGKCKPLIFVTDDVKENWWQPTCGGRRDPQPVLVQEALARIKAGVLFYTSERFSETAPSRLGVSISKTLADETKKIREEERLVREILTRRIARQESDVGDKEICPRCGAIGTQCATEGSDCGELCWFECSSCHYFEER